MYLLRNSLLLILLSLIALPSFSQQAAPNINQQLVQYFQNQEYAKAAQYLRQTMNDTMSSRSRSLLGYSYYMSNQFTKATSCFSGLLALDPDNASACYYLGKIQAAKGNLPKALSYFCRLVEIKPGISNYYKQLASLWNKTGNGAAAGWYYQLAYQANPNDAEVIASLAANRISQEMYQQADSILDLALCRDSMQARLLSVRIHSAYAQEAYQDIFPLYRQLRKMHFVSLRPYLYTAIACFDLKKYDSCIAICQLLSEKKMETRTTIYLEALSYKELKQYDKALDRLNICLAMSLDKAADNYFTVKGNILELMHEPSLALKQYDTAYYIFHNPVQLYNKARVFDAKFENYKAALRYYHRYQNHQNKPDHKEEKKILAFVKKRIKQLEEWKNNQP